MDPERPIEKVLRDYAKERREQAGTPELHPATRRLLQSEVARQYPAPPQPRRSLMERLFQWRPAWALAFGVVTAVVLLALLAPVLTKPKSHVMDLAQDKSAPAAAVEREAGGAGLSEPKVADAATLPAARPPAAASPRAGVAATPSRMPASAPAASPTGAITLAANELNRKEGDSGFLDSDRAARRLTLQAGEEVALANQPAKDADQLLGLAKQRMVESKDAREDADYVQAQDQLRERGSAVVASSATESLKLKSLANGNAKTEAGALPAPTSRAVTVASAPPPAATAPTVAYDELARAPITTAEEKAPAVAFGESVGGALAAAAPARRRDVRDAVTGRAYFARAQESRKVPGVVSFSRVSSTSLLKAAANNEAPLPVLFRFQVEQTGPELKMVDADGSLYTGSVQLVQTASGKETDLLGFDSKAAKPEPAAKGVTAGVAWADGQARGGYAFQVTGTNRSLREPITFSGQLIPVTVAQTNLAFGAQLQAPGAALATQSLPLSGSRIQGVLKIGKQELEINALPQP